MTDSAHLSSKDSRPPRHLSEVLSSIPGGDTEALILHQFSVAVVRGIREKDEEARAERDGRHRRRWGGMAGVDEGRAGEQREARGGNLKRVVEVWKNRKTATRRGQADIEEGGKKDKRGAGCWTIREESMSVEFRLTFSPSSVQNSLCCLMFLRCLFLLWHDVSEWICCLMAAPYLVCCLFLEPPPKWLSVKVNTGPWWLRAPCFCCRVCLSAAFPPSPFLVMQTVNCEVVCAVFRQEGGISRLTFWKCHSPPLCTSVKISQPGREMLMQEFTLLKHIWLFRSCFSTFFDFRKCLNCSLLVQVYFTQSLVINRLIIIEQLSRVKTSDLEKCLYRTNEGQLFIFIDQRSLLLFVSGLTISCILKAKKCKSLSSDYPK